MMASTDRVSVFNVLTDERVGGPPLRVLRVAERLRRDGIDTAIVVPRGDPTFARLAEGAGIRCHRPWAYVRLPHTVGPAWLVSPIALLKWLALFLPGVLSLRGLFRRYGAAIVHVNGLICFQAAIAARLSGAKVVWHLNDTVTPKAFRMVLMPVLRGCSTRVAASATTVASFYLGDKAAHNGTAILYPPVDTSKFRPEGDLSAHRKQFGLEPGVKVVGTVGNFDAVKGYEYFLEAAAEVKESCPHVRFLMVGDKLKTQQGYWQRVQRAIDRLGLRPYVIMAGKRDDIPQLMGLMDVYVLSSVSEAAPLVVLEAMACGRPVVATRVGGVAELVANGETGIVVPPRDSLALARGIVRLLNNTRLAASMGERGRQRAVAEFDLEHCARRHRELYLGIVGRTAA